MQINILNETFKWLVEQVEAVLTIIVLPVIIWLHQKRRKIRNYYQVVWKNSKRLKDKELHGFSSRPFHQYYHKRTLDGIIRANLQAKKGEVKNIMIVGPPLSGKTRSVLQAFREIKRKHDVLVPRIVDIDREKFPVPLHLKLRKKIVFIDDLHLFVEKQNFEVLFENFKGQVIIATCRSGDEFKKVSGKLADHNLGSFFSEVCRD